ncbi:MAG: hybrid sensor histidine kinase/response regulator [Actinobacteria bacterium]|nr:hybrid sensor histidine kinase/response regulator [Actinomycetota bacterium]
MSEKSENEFLGFVAHELRTPITVIVGLASTLVARRRDLTDEQVDECLERIRVQGDRLARLVGDLLDLAQIDSGRFQVALEPVDLAAAGRRTLDDVPAPPGRSVELALPEDVWVVADPGRLEQVLVNLLTNAYRHGGPNVRLGARRTPDGVYVEVSDDGAGVPEGLVPGLFEKFSREASEGAGLGLAITRGLVEAFGGRVWYDPGDLAGARFSVLLNETEANPRSSPAGSERHRWSKGVRKILVVDDESSMRFLLRMVFESEGFEVVEAHHGAAALERVKEDPPPDLVVTDLMMPVMGGRELVERLRANPETARIPILVVSANASAVVPGADAALRKPFDRDALLDTARSLARKDAA